jgi:hypothetical protein
MDEYTKYIQNSNIYNIYIQNSNIYKTHKVFDIKTQRAQVYIILCFIIFFSRHGIHVDRRSFNQSVPVYGV